VRTALSYVSVDAARANLAAEGGASFDDVRAAASSQWNAALSRIAVAGTNAGDVKTFYTSLYRSLLHPNTFDDADGRYIGFDGDIHSVVRGHTQYANFSDWDTYRCLAALQALLFPERASDMAQSLVNDAKQSGSYPRWALANSATGEMTGDSVVPLIVNLYTFGAKDFDLKTALYFMLKAATDGGVGLNGYVERPGIASYLQHGYAPQTEEFSGDHGMDGASITLEWSVDDFAISRFANALGESVIGAEFQNRAQYWQNLFNPLTGYITPRRADGISLVWPGFAGPTSDFGQDGFDEGNAEQYLWLVPQAW
jgi:predicted alpha-1,2-mannosidase